MVVMTNQYDTEELKRTLAMNDNNFFLIPSSNPRNNYEVLWYTLHTDRNGEHRACKVDILCPGIMDIPFISTEHVVRLQPPTKRDMQELPVMPLEPLILLKLQGWSDHRKSPRKDFQEKQHTDVDDIEELMDICVEAGIKPHDAHWLDYDFRMKAYDRVNDFVEVFPEVWGWAELGYEVY
jgi:hypothetical protein